MSPNENLVPDDYFDYDFVTPPATPPPILTPPPSPYSENETDYSSDTDSVNEVEHEGKPSTIRNPEHDRKADENNVDPDEQNGNENGKDDNETGVDVDDHAQEIVDVYDQKNNNGRVEVNEMLMIELKDTISRNIPFLDEKRREPRSQSPPS